MYSFLEEIDKYIKEKKIPFEKFTISSSYFPVNFNTAILNKLRKLETIDKDADRLEFGPEEYTFFYDNLDNLCMLAVCGDKKTNLVICGKYKEIDVNFRSATTTDTSIIKNACMIEYLQQLRETIRKGIYKSNPNILPKERVKLEREIMDEVIDEEFKKLKRENKKAIDLVPYEEEQKMIVQKIEDYLDYLKELYETTVIMEEPDYISNITFTSSEPDSKERTSSYIPQNGQHQVNETIPIYNRELVLDSYEFKYKGIATSSDKTDFDYTIRLYDDKENNLYILIMEPTSGEKYTKVNIFEKPENFYREDFDALIRELLELSNKEFTEREDTVNAGHTTLQTFKKVIEYTITGNATEFYNYGYRSKVDGIKKRILTKEEEK